MSDSFRAISYAELTKLYNNAAKEREENTQVYFNLEFPESLDYLADDEKMEQKLCRQIDEALIVLESLPLTIQVKDRFANILMKFYNTLSNVKDLQGVQSKIVIAQACRDKILEWYNQFDEVLDKNIRAKLLILGNLFNKIVKYMCEHLPID